MPAKRQHEPIHDFNGYHVATIGITVVEYYRASKTGGDHFTVHRALARVYRTRAVATRQADRLTKKYGRKFHVLFNYL